MSIHLQIVTTFDQDIEAQKKSLLTKEQEQQNAAIERDKKLSVQVLTKLIAKFDNANDQGKKGKGKKKGKKGKSKKKKK